MASPQIPPSSSSSSPIHRLPTFNDRTINAEPPQPSPLETFASDPVFSAFLSPSFDSAAFSSQALSSGSAAARAESLQESIRLLNRHLRSEVLSRHPHLLSSLLSLRQASTSLSSLRPAVDSLTSSLQRTRQDLATPRSVLKTRTIQLKNLLATADLLHHSERLLKLAARLRDERLDLARAAELHREAKVLYEEKGLAGIEAVDEQMRTLGEASGKLRAEAAAAAERGMDGSNQNDIWVGLQVYYNLGELRPAVEALVSKYKVAGIKSINTALDMKAISSATSSGGFGGPGGVQRSGTPQIGSGKKAGEALWDRMRHCMDELYHVMAAVWQLQSVLTKKRLPFTQVLFLQEVWQEGEPLLTERVWEALVKAFAYQMKSAYTASSFVKEIFTIDYPRLFLMVENLLERISRDTDVKGVIPALSLEGRAQMVGAIQTFQVSFLALCLSRLSDHVNTIFPVSSRGIIPSKDQISRLISRIQEEIELVRMHGPLLHLVLREIAKVLHLLAERAEYQISTGPEARQVTGPATAAQLKNFALYQHLQEIHSRISTTMSTLPDSASKILSRSLKEVYEVECNSVSLLFKSMLEQLKSCINKMHQQNFGGDATDDGSLFGNSASPYMEELQKCTLDFRREFLSKLLPASSASRSEAICTRLVREMASEILVYFIRNASLVRPLSEAGKLRMARDMAELELAVQNLFPVEQLGPPYRALRAFRPVIFLETSQLVKSPLLQDLPPSVILHHLYSRGPDELESPMQKNKLTLAQYLLWLDSQGEDQIWKGIKATLDDYEMKVRGRGDKEFSPVYPIMLQIGSVVAQSASLL
ncbi:conserved oligomeric Golgi complex subunit 5-like isoform X1 [Carex littledalei]|uniref:Conserved oligomeric Golgi complex subunit 5 n=1 Tax=Carex littledalei TaxID=544730 RepID=A0A833RLJ6_9POAL|nr:conserved oligomeric Golgi complex subunit 5-like isoform X1 [Carex littledalei]